MASVSVQRLFVRLLAAQAIAANVGLATQLLTYASSTVLDTLSGTTITGTAGNGRTVSLSLNAKLDSVDVAEMVSEILDELTALGLDGSTDAAADRDALLAVLTPQDGTFRSDFSMLCQ